MPEWVDPRVVWVTVGAVNRRVAIDGRRVRIGRLNPGDVVALTFPVPEQTVHRVLGEIPYKLTMHGSSVTAIDPKGIAMPLYEDQPTGTMVRKTRFVPGIQGVIW